MNILELLGLASSNKAARQYPRPVPAPGDEPYSLPPISSPTQSQPEEPITITGQQGFHPRKPSLLAILGDALLIKSGHKPMFSQNRRDEDYRRAMADYTTDPLQAIKNIGALKGHEKEAAQLYDMYSRGQTADANLERQNKVFDLKLEDYVRDRVAGAMSVIKPGDTEGYRRMRERMLGYASAKGVDLSADLPENGDQFDIDSFRYGQIDPYKQERLKQFNTQEQGRNDRFYAGEAGKNSRFQQGQANIDRRQAAKKTDKPLPDRIISTKYGPGKIFNKGQNLSVKLGKNPDGSDRYAIYEKKEGNNWHLAGYK